MAKKVQAAPLGSNHKEDGLLLAIVFRNWPRVWVPGELVLGGSSPSETKAMILRLILREKKRYGLVLDLL